MTHEKNNSGAEPSVAEPDLEISVQEATSLDFIEARILVDRIFEEYLDSGGRSELDQLLENREHLPWYLQKGDAPR